MLKEVRRTEKQKEIISIFKKGHENNTPLMTAYDLIDKLSYKIARSALRHSLKILISHGDIEVGPLVRVPLTGGYRRAFKITRQGLDLKYPTKIDKPEPKPNKYPSINRKLLTLEEYKVHELIGGARRRSGDEYNLPDADITYKDLLIPEYCPVFPWIKLTYDGSDRFNSGASLDRLIPSKGYVKGNVRVISMRANRIKGYCSLQELVYLGNWAREELVIIESEDR